MVKNPPASAGGVGSFPGRGRCHMLQSSLADEPQLLKPARLKTCALQQKTPLQWEAHTPQLECGPRSNNVWLSPFTVQPETTTTLLIGYTPIQNKKFKVWKKILCSNKLKRLLREPWSTLVNSKWHNPQKSIYFYKLTQQNKNWIFLQQAIK